MSFKNQCKKEGMNINQIAIDELNNHAKGNIELSVGVLRYMRSVLFHINKNSTPSKTQPAQIQEDEWYFLGCFIQKDDSPLLSKYRVFVDDLSHTGLGQYSTFEASIEACKDHFNSLQ